MRPIGLLEPVDGGDPDSAVPGDALPGQVIGGERVMLPCGGGFLFFPRIRFTWEKPLPASALLGRRAEVFELGLGG